MPVDPDTLRRIHRLVLQNASQHAGTPRPGPVLARLLATQPELRSVAAEVETAVRGAIDDVARLSPEAVASALTELGGPEADRPARPQSDTGEFPELAGARPGEVVLRMAPFPSGTLHIGNARMIFVNEYYRRKYGGRLLLVFDDTIGSEEKRVDPEVFGLIQHDLELCGSTPDAVFYKSDRIRTVLPVGASGHRRRRGVRLHLPGRDPPGQSCARAGVLPPVANHRRDRLGLGADARRFLPARRGGPAVAHEPLRARPRVPGPGPVPHQRPRPPAGRPARTGSGRFSSSPGPSTTSSSG